ncbi:hypothetical protein ISN45_Aa04g006540 [Arabidopsis thaliana x Arabidopsis arenosa]|uniref:Uncharacterized protein n=1 Tax=Arabidopsis thaliana x Arabidopsis arenosa TaxID=1240361 RepID=A0A8T2A4I8_9BRAS|nr:hypothetical protein ISN45_Aa04g006540 [Arabidopsis thaliana x Arabidopsis arenosa]
MMLQLDETRGGVMPHLRKTFVVPKRSEHENDPLMDDKRSAFYNLHTSNVFPMQEKAKGKRPAAEGSGGKKKRARKSRGEAPIYKDRVASANFIAFCAGPMLPAPENLFASNFLKAFSSMNSMVYSYDSEVREHAAAREQFEKALADAKIKSAEAITKQQEAEAKAAAEKVERLRLTDESLRLRQRSEAEIERLKRLLTEEKFLREKEVARARKAAKREMTAEFAEKVKATEAKMVDFEEVSERYMYFVQAKATIELISELEGGKKIEEEKEEVLRWKAEFADAEEEYIRLGTTLREDLKIPPVSPDSVHDSLGQRSIEGAADEVGVIDQSGSNLGAEPTQTHEAEQDE